MVRRIARTGLGGFALGASLASVVVACGGDGDGDVCEPGRTETCACVGGAEGAQTCFQGIGWGECECPGEDETAGEETLTGAEGDGDSSTDGDATSGDGTSGDGDGTSGDGDGSSGDGDGTAGDGDGSSGDGDGSSGDGDGDGTSGDGDGDGTSGDGDGDGTSGDGDGDGTSGDGDGTSGDGDGTSGDGDGTSGDGDGTSGDGDGSAPGILAYQDIPDLDIFSTDLRRVRWHPSGRFAVLLAQDGGVFQFTQATASVDPLTNLGFGADDIDVAADGSYFAIVGTEGGLGKLWQLDVDASDVITVAPAVDVGETPVSIVRSPDGSEFAIAAQSAMDTINWIHLWNPTMGVHRSKAFFAGAGIWDVMWADPNLYVGSLAIVSSHGVNGADSQTWILDNDMVVDNMFSLGFGNSGAAGWRPGGEYGYTCGWSSNKLYVFAGTWTLATLPGVGTAAQPQAIAWKDDGSRALIVGTTIGPGVQAVVTDHRASGQAGFLETDLVNASLGAFDQAPWFGSSSSGFRDADWRPNSACDEGLIVAGENGRGWLIRYYDSDDPDCP